MAQHPDESPPWKSHVYVGDDQQEKRNYPKIVAFSPPSSEMGK